MDAKQFIESGILETYAMGLASEQEAEMVAEMVARYPVVKSELKAIQASIENFDQKNAVEPPAHLKLQILSQIDTIATAEEEGGAKLRALYPPNPETRRKNFYKITAIAASIALFISIMLNVQTRKALDRSEKEYSTLQKDWLDASGRAIASETYIEYLKKDIAILSAPGMKSIELKGMPDVAPDAKAMVYANPTTGDAYLSIIDLPAAPDGMQYQFWGIVDGKPVDAGMISLDEFSYAMREMKVVPNTTAYAISLEPVGGSQQPTGKIYVMGNS